METPPPPSVNDLPPSTVNNNSQGMNSQPSLSQTISLQPSSSNSNTIPSSPPKLNKLPVLSSSNSSVPNLNSFTSEDVSPSQFALNNINKTNDITPPIVIKNPTLPENINNLDTSKLVAKKNFLPPVQKSKLNNTLFPNGNPLKIYSRVLNIGYKSIQKDN